jgi:hypothetical protein
MRLMIGDCVLTTLLLGWVIVGCVGCGCPCFAGCGKPSWGWYAVVWLVEGCGCRHFCVWLGGVIEAMVRDVVLNLSIGL